MKVNRMKHIALLVLPLLIASGMTGCGSSPTVREQQQWTRTLSSTHAITPKASMKVAVT